MKYAHIFILGFFLIFLQNGFSQVETLPKTEQTQTKPRITILATGGTIAGSGASDTRAAYKAGEVPIEALLEAVPEIHNQAKIKGEQIANIGSQDMNIKTWLELSKRINEIFEADEADGIVITHGTDTMEETAYFLSLTVPSNKPVVLVGAMRAATAMSQDGNRNLLDAVTVASDEKSKKIGVVVVMNEYIFDARSVEKTSTTNIAAFDSRNFGPIGVVFDNKVSYYRESLRKPSAKFDVRQLETLPRVDIFYGYAGQDPEMIAYSANNGAAGIVYAGVGNGNFSTPVEMALAKAVQSGVIVCRASRISSGRVTLENEVDDEGLGFIVADDLSPQKARILLMLSLTETEDKATIQQLFFNY